MKKFISVLLALAITLSLAGCSLFSDSSVVKLGEDYTHKDPKDLTYDQRVVLRGENFQDTLEEMVNSAAYPDTMMYDDDGSIIGMYDYDESTGLAKGWTDLTNGSYHAYDEGEEVDLGLPDASQMVEIPGTVTLYFVVYGNKGETEAAYLYAMLSDADAKEPVESSMESFYGIALTEESDTVLTSVIDADAIAAEFSQTEDTGMTTSGRDAEAYADLLKQAYGVRTYGGVNPYKPYDGHSDPEGLEFDQKVILTGPGTAAVPEENAGDISSITDYIYGNKGEVVAQYTYIECPSKESADKLMDDEVYNSAVRVSDTVIENVVEGDDMSATLSSYIGYNVLKDKSVEEYVRMIEETYYSDVYEQG